MRRVPELRHIEYTSIREDQRPSVDVLLFDVLQDRQREHTGPERHERVRIQPPDLARLTERERADAERNIRLLSLAKGHRGRMIRNVAARGTSAEADHLRSLLSWAEETLRTGMASVEPLVAAPPSEWWASAETPEDLYERIAVIERSGTNDATQAEAWLVRTLAECAGHPDPAAKWTDLVGPVFLRAANRQTLETILSRVGFLPRGLTTRKAFRALPAETVASVINALRDLESSPLRPLARYERARLINAFVIRGRASDLRRGKGTRPVTLDTNGIRIDAGDFHAHLPYGLAEPEFAETLQKEHWTAGDPTLAEIRLRTAEENTDGQAAERLGTQQLAGFLADMGFREPGASEACAERIVEAPDQVAKTVLEKGLVVPDRLIRDMQRRGPRERYALLRFAEGIGAALTEERLTRRAHLFLSYDLMREQDEAYKTRTRILHHPSYYNALKIVRGWLSEPVVPDPGRRFLAFHGQYQQVAGNEPHTFVAAVHDGRVARVLVDDQKHLHQEHRDALTTLPKFDREQYEALEDILRTFDYYSGTVNAIRKESAAPPKSWPRRYFDLAQTGLHFVLSNVTTLLPEATRRYQATVDENASRASVESFLEVLDEARQTYAEFLYGNVGSPSELQQEFMPEIERRAVAFGPEFLSYAERVCADDGFDRRLIENAAPIRTVILRYKSKDPTGAIPYHVEESCLEALRLDRDRPFVNVIGGCRFVGGSLEDATHPLNRMATSVLKVAHDTRANVAVPGTQSGIGVAFGLANVHYRNEFGHLPAKDQMHMFAVSPGGNTAFPGNDLVEQAEQWQRFAVTPVDSAITPFESDWGATGMARLIVPYREHIQYMEALFDRMSRDRKRVMVVGNGGHFSAMEVNEALKRGFDLLLIRDSGRFAEAAAAALASGESLGDGSPESAARVIELVRAGSQPDAAEEFLRKDFGPDALNPTETQAAFRILFFNFLRVAKQTDANIQLTTLDRLESDLRAKF